MKRIKNNIAVFRSKEEFIPLVIKFCDIVKKYPSILTPFRGANDEAKVLLASSGFMLYPTVKKTTVIYEEKTDCFLKVLHPLSNKEKIIYFLTDKGDKIYNLSKYLSFNGIMVPEVVSYGYFKNGRKPFFVMKRVPGVSLYDILIREGKTLEKGLYFKVIEKVVEVHKLGYCLGDAHLSHIFIDKGSVSGFIDIDNIRKNTFFILRNRAKDIAGFNHPGIPLTKDEKKELLGYYMDIIGIKDSDRFIKLVRYFSERRWKKYMLKMRQKSVMSRGDKIFNILHIIPKLSVGGVENMLYKVVTKYNRERFNPVVCCIGKGGEIADKIQKEGIKVYILHRMRRNSFDLNAVKDIYRLIKKENIHILRTHQFHGNLYGRIAGVIAGVKIMVPSFHNVYRSPGKPKFIRCLLNHFLSKFSYKLVAVSESIARDIMRYDRVGAEKIKVINNGVELRRFDLKISKEEARSKLNLPDSLVIIGTVGRLHKQKGHKFLIESVSYLNDILLAIAGEGELKEELKKEAERLGVNCRFMGSLDPHEVPIFLRAIDIFCFPSLWEGFPSSLVEAMASGLPVIASDIPPIKEILDNSGILVPPGDSEKLGQALQTLIEEDPSLRKLLGTKAKERANLFSIERTVSSYESLFDEALRKKGFL